MSTKDKFLSVFVFFVGYTFIKVFTKSYNNTREIMYGKTYDM